MRGGVLMPSFGQEMPEVMLNQVANGFVITITHMVDQPIRPVPGYEPEDFLTQLVPESRKYVAMDLEAALGMIRDFYAQGLAEVFSINGDEEEKLDGDGFDPNDPRHPHF